MALKMGVLCVAVLVALIPAASSLHSHSTRDGEVGQGNLVFMHIPYNFGHTIEKVAMFKPGASIFQVMFFMFQGLGGFSNNRRTGDIAGLWKKVNKSMKAGGVAWGHFNPDLSPVLKETGCSAYFSPQKYWPKELAQSYFGNKTVFGMLRDPYERLVAQFRGNAQLKFIGQDYGTVFKQKYVSSCDVNNAIKEALKEYIASDNKFQSACTFLPQAEYFDGEFGIKLPVDNRLFPDSMNKVFKEHNYTEQIKTADIFHVGGCPDVWAADLDAETRALVRQVFKRDFELNCKHFGYCNYEENTCIHGVPQMCPSSQCGGGKCAGGI